MRTSVCAETPGLPADNQSRYRGQFGQSLDIVSEAANVLRMGISNAMNKVRIATLAEIDPPTPAHALIADVDLVIVRWPDEDEVTVLYGRCLHRGALLSDGEVQGENLICGVHGWDYRFRTGVSAYTNEDVLHRFSHWIEGGEIFVDEDEVREWERCHPQPFDRSAYQGAYADPHGTPAEPYIQWIQEMAEYGLERTGHHGRVDAMGVPRDELPTWERYPDLDGATTSRAPSR